MTPLAQLTTAEDESISYRIELGVEGAAPLMLQGVLAPEPSTASLLLFGGVVLAARRRR